MLRVNSVNNLIFCEPMYWQMISFMWYGMNTQQVFYFAKGEKEE